MILVCTASADTYITNKIINGNVSVTDANVGLAGTLDLFKLYDETKLNNIGSQTELSRILLRFDLQPLFDATGTNLNISSDRFKAFLQLFNIAAGNSSPKNFNVVVYPLAQSFDEGIGRDTAAFNDLDVANFVTASYTTQSNVWFLSGANAGGLLGSSDIDFISSGNLGAGIVNTAYTQNFANGNEDLCVDVTQAVSATLAGILPNKGFRLSFTNAEEIDTKTRFVKRFASRHVTNKLLAPRLLVKFDDTLNDFTSDFRFDATGTLFLQSFNNSTPSNIVSGASLTQVTGNNCILLHLQTGSFNFVVTGSQHKCGTGNNFLPGVYSASFALTSCDTTPVTGTITLADVIAASGSVTFSAFWKSLDGTLGYHTGSLNVARPARTRGNFTSRRPFLRITNARNVYSTSDVFRFRVFGVDLETQFYHATKRARKLTSVIFDKVYYQIIDKTTGKVVIPYDTVVDATRLSVDSEGMFFNFNMQALPTGRTYGVQFLVNDRGQSYVSEEDGTVFNVRN